MNVVAIYEDINLITEYDARRIKQIVCKYAKQTCIHYPKDLLRHDISILLLMYILVSDGEDVRYNMNYLRYNDWGFPSFSKAHSISYCTNAVCGVISEAGVGIDIQDIIAIESEILKEFASKSEICFLNNHDNREINTVILFTLKECFGKYLNVGLNYLLTEIELLNENRKFEKYGLQFETQVFENFIVSLCSVKGIIFQCKIISYDELMNLVNYLSQI